MGRIKLEMSLMDMFMTMSEGNPGALTVLMDIFKEGERIDPQDFMGGLGAILMLDELGVYGPRVWMLYKDVCGQDLLKTVAMTRAFQLGYVTEDQLNYAIDNYGEGLDVDLLVLQVQERLEQFAR